MAIEFRCKSCTKWLRVGDETAGRQARCPACGELSQVPSADSPRLSDDSTPTWETLGAAPAPWQPAADSPFAATPPPAADSEENPYQSPAAMEPWEGRDPHAHDYLDYALASRGTRFVGAILDGLIYLVGMAPGFIVAVAMAEGDGPDMEMAVMALMFGGMLIVGIVNWVMITQSGQSIAKRLLRMRIVRIDDGALPGFVRGVILRIWIPAVINQFCGLFSLLDALWIFGQERRCIHDYIAMTRVVSDATGPSPARCPNCGDNLSRKALKCPNCGSPQLSRRWGAP